MLTPREQQQAAKKFANDWKDKGKEIGESQKFWCDLLCHVFGVQDFANYIDFEIKVPLDHSSRADGYISATKVLIEQKSIDKDLKAPIKQSDGSLLDPFSQAKRYAMDLGTSKFPRWIITCNFKSFLVYDMENPRKDPEEILLKNLEKEYYRLSFLVNDKNIHLQKEFEVSVKAGDIIGKLYNLIKAQYHDADNPSPATLRSLNMLCVRIVFCLYAEDAGIFGNKSSFGDYLSKYDASDLRGALLELFKVLDQKPENRDEYMKPVLAAFPYVNGGLFTEEDTTIPQLTDEIKNLLVKQASNDFDWSEISPTIFGAIFESTLNPVTRREGGMHYTSIENIHKVIDPLFLNDLLLKFETIKKIRSKSEQTNAVTAFQKKLGSLKFLDPASGSGNFLTETYLCLRRLENECLKMRFNNKIMLDVFDDAIYVSINQFYGIEINDFAVVVAKTALWIAEHQMLKETANIIQKDLNFLPLKSYANIVEANALTTDWETVVSKNELSYIVGNPPFVGSYLMDDVKREEIKAVFPECKNPGEIDYVAGWYAKAGKYMQGTQIECALVSTNSICQGQQVAWIWKPLFEQYGIVINFAHRTFRWDSEANIKAHVHCVIVGFSCFPTNKTKMVYSKDAPAVICKKINGYLLDLDNFYVTKSNKTLTNIPKMKKGSSPVDDGNFFLTAEEREKILKKEPMAEKFIRKFYGAEEYIHNKERWCLWLLDATPKELQSMPLVMERVNQVREYRLTSKKAATRKYANYATRFMEVRQPTEEYILVPRHTSENRDYIPIGYVSADVICGDANSLIPLASLFHFGVLTSNIHNAWMRTVCGRIKSDYRYSNEIVYNNFPWCCPTVEQKAKIEQTAQAILDARQKYADSSLADMYGENMYLYTDLLEAHKANDKAVMQAYGFKKAMSEMDIVTKLLQMYEKLVNQTK